MNSDEATQNTSDNLNSDAPQYDRGIVPAETAARKEREGDAFGNTSAGHDPESINTTGGITVDNEGLTNNYAIEPEMYVDEPGDLREEEEAATADRAHELHDVQHNDETGKLTDESDTRGKGPGVM